MSSSAAGSVEDYRRRQKTIAGKRFAAQVLHIAELAAGVLVDQALAQYAGLLHDDIEQDIESFVLVHIEGREPVYACGGEWLANAAENLKPNSILVHF